MRHTRLGTWNSEVYCEKPRIEVKDLMYAVLFEAMRDVAKPNKWGSKPASAYRWFKSSNKTYVFSLYIICQTLGLDYGVFSDIDKLLPKLTLFFEQSDQMARNLSGRKDSPRLSLEMLARTGNY